MFLIGLINVIIIFLVDGCDIFIKPDLGPVRIPRSNFTGQLCVCGNPGLALMVRCVEGSAVPQVSK